MGSNVVKEEQSIKPNKLEELQEERVCKIPKLSEKDKDHENSSQGGWDGWGWCWKKNDKGWWIQDKSGRWWKWVQNKNGKWWIQDSQNNCWKKDKYSNWLKKNDDGSWQREQIPYEWNIQKPNFEKIYSQKVMIDIRSAEELINKIIDFYSGKLIKPVPDPFIESILTVGYLDKLKNQKEYIKKEMINPCIIDSVILNDILKILNEQDEIKFTYIQVDQYQD